jgi:type VI secretion system protein ImpK
VLNEKPRDFGQKPPPLRPLGGAGPVDEDRTVISDADPERTVVGDGDPDRTIDPEADHTVATEADPERTILMPRPGGQPTAPRRTPAKKPMPRLNTGGELQRLVAGINPLLGAANMLLALIPQLRATTSHADPAGLRLELLERLREFEDQARAAGVPRPQVTAARYLLCSFVDEVIAGTPWGAGGAWAERNLLQEFHDERWGGDKAFKLLERLGEDANTNRDLLELFYVCIALGFEGRYRGQPNGRAQLEAVANRLFELIHPPAERPATRTLSLHWQGVSPPRRSLTVLPLWVVVAVGAAVVLGGLLWMNAQLDRMAAPAFRQIHAAAAAARLAPGGQAGEAARPRLAPLLQSDIASRAVEVRDEPLRSVLSLPADTLFLPGSARLDARQQDVLRRAADALAKLPGEIVVIGHTDNQPLRSLQFPSHWHLSREQAHAVLEGLVQAGAPRERLRAEGHADADARAPNDTPEGRSRNRRVDIAVLLPRPDSQGEAAR